MLTIVLTYWKIGSEYAMDTRLGFRKRAAGGVGLKHPKDARQTARVTRRGHLTRYAASVILGLGLMSNYISAADLDKTDMRQDNRWLKDHLLNDKAQLPFSF